MRGGVLRVCFRENDGKPMEACTLFRFRTLLSVVVCACAVCVCARALRYLLLTLSDNSTTQKITEGFISTGTLFKSIWCDDASPCPNKMYL